jgi:DNA-binding NarL/FixJ family response regulator
LVSSPIRIVLVDDHSIVRRGIKALLGTETEIQVVGEAENGFEAVEATGRLLPDVVLMDLDMPKMNGIEAIKQIALRWPAVAVLVLTSFTSDQEVVAAVKAGALGYILKDTEPEDLVQAIKQVYRREPSLHPKIARILLEEVTDGSQGSGLAATLSRDEVEVLRLLTMGRDTAQIAGGIAKSADQVRAHISTILAKLHLASRTEAVLLALREGLAQPDEASPIYLTRLLEAVQQEQETPAGKPVPSGRKPLKLTDPSPGLAELIREHREIELELTLAGRIQSSFLPRRVPEVPGWEFAANLLPARETSGDFYDLIQLPDSRVGLVVADVTDKGMGAALYMALTRTLMRTFALEKARKPHQVLQEVNRRILADTQGGYYVTLFYGVLGLETGILDYSNAGHPPAMLVRGPEAERLRVLSRTGPPLGIDRDSSWEYAAVSLQPGDQLVLYTDGISEARNPDSQLFGIERLVQTVLANSSRSAAETQETILRLVDRFGGDQPRADDIALVVARRMPAGRAEASGPTAVSQPLARD